MRELSVLFRGITKGGHVHIGVFAGPDRENRAKAGDIVLRVEEWAVVREALTRRDAKGLVTIEVADPVPTVDVREHDEGCAWPIQMCLCDGPRRTR